MVDKKLTGLDTLTSVTNDDLLYIVDSPTGTTVSKSIRVDNFLGFCGARYSSNSGQYVSGTVANIINFEDVVYDTDTAVTIGESWKFTCPANKGGYYLINAMIIFDVTNVWDAGDLIQLFIYKNNGIYSRIYVEYWQSTISSIYRQAFGSDVICLNPGDYIDVRIYFVSEGVISLPLVNDVSFNHIAINRLLGI